MNTIKVQTKPFCSLTFKVRPTADLNKMTSISLVDYFVLIGILFVCALIGVFHAFRGTRTSKGYFLGNRNMSAFPVAVSLVVSVMSAVTYLGTPVDVYMHGPKFGLMCMNKIIVALVVTTVTLPVFYRLGVTSVYEYLDVRFNKVVRYAVVTVEIFFSTLYLGIVIYAPSLALSTVTGLNLTSSILAIGVVCTFYTTVGGMKAVIWTDVFQAAVMMIGFMLMTIVGTVKIGGVGESWQRAVEGQRNQLIDFNPDPTIRLSFWSIFIGGSLFSISFMGAKQSAVQRYNSCATEGKAKLAAWVGILGLGIVEIFAVATGMTMYAYYAYCDPLSQGLVSKPDQLIPYFIIDLFYSIPGLPGILLGGAFCASLSTMSSILNGLAAVTGNDFIKVIWKDLPETQYLLIIKAVSVVYGTLSVVVAFLVPSLGKILQVTLSIGGVFGGPVLGVFCLGMLVRRANSFSAFIGLVCGVCVGVTFQIGSLFYPQSGSERLPLSVEGCITDEFNVTSDVNNLSESTTVSLVYDVLTTPGILDDHAFTGRLFGISFLHYATVTLFTTLLVGIVSSLFCCGVKKDEVDPLLLSPVIQNFYHHQPKSDVLPGGEEVQMMSYEENDKFKL